MKIRIRILLTTLTVSAFALMNGNLFAHDGGHDGGGGDEGGGDGEGDHQGEHQHVDGNESLHAVTVLNPTAAAATNAIGFAKIDNECDESTNNASLEVKTRGLDAGTYSLSVVKASDSSTEVLGNFDVGMSGDDADENDDDENSMLESETRISLPSDLTPTDIAQIIVSDTNGVALLVGDVGTNSASAAVKFKAVVRITPGVLAPSAKGKAMINVNLKRKKNSQRFTLIASGVPANATLNVQVEGTQVGTVNTTKKGKLLIRKLNANLLNVHNVSVVDTSGQQALSAHF